MDKLQYDSFYKFIVSVGIVLIVAPLFCLHYLVSGSYDIIMTQEEANNLSEISSDFLSIKIQYVQNIFKYLPIICIVFIIISRSSSLLRRCSEAGACACGAASSAGADAGVRPSAKS